jgi:hypothetical protein
MKWRTVRADSMWYTGPQEGIVKYCAQKGGVKYEVRAYWKNALDQKQGIRWWASGTPIDRSGVLFNLAYLTKDGATHRCVQHAERKGAPIE